MDAQPNLTFDLLHVHVEKPDLGPMGVAGTKASGRLMLNRRGVTILDIENPQLKLENERDLMVVTFESVNMRIRTSSREMEFFNRWPRSKDSGESTATSFISRQWLEVADTEKAAYMILHLPPQSIVEQAFDDSKPLKEYPPIKARMSGPSRLVFKVPEEAEPIPLNREALFDSLRFAMKLVPSVRPKGEIKVPSPTETAIEFPYRLFISPDEDENGGKGENAWRWQRSLPTEGREGWEPLWNLSYENSHFDPLAPVPPTIRAVWSPDFGCNNSCDPEPLFVPFTLSPRNRNDIVVQSHQEGAEHLAPVNANKLILTPLGAWSDLYGLWADLDQFSTGTPQDKSLESWEHLTTMGREHRVVIIRRGSLFPFGHKAALFTVS
jgi:hypothetical protein